MPIDGVDHAISLCLSPDLQVHSVCASGSHDLVHFALNNVVVRLGRSAHQVTRQFECAQTYRRVRTGLPVRAFAHLCASYVDEVCRCLRACVKCNARRHRCTSGAENESAHEAQPHAPSVKTLPYTLPESNIPYLLC